MKYFLFCVGLMAAMPVAAAVTSPMTRIAAAEAVRHPASRDGEPKYIPVILRIADGSDLSDLEARGVVVFHTRGDMALACVPETELSQLDRMPAVARAEAARRAVPCLDKARAATRADLRETLPQHAFTGRGVVVGFADTGFDAGHVAFDGRVDAVYDYDETTATRLAAENAAAIAARAADAPHEFHATHVAGILAGGDMSVPYYGVATGADIVATTSRLYDTGILAGVEDVIARARAQSKPAVVNLSLGSNTGPHDGADLFCRYLDGCGEEAAILLSAGNHGQDACSARRVLGDGADMMSVMLESTDWNDVMQVNGVADIWSDNGAPFEARIRIWDHYGQKTVYESDWFSADSDNDIMLIDNTAEGWPEGVFGGEVMCAGEINPDNGRGNITVKTELYGLEAFPGHSWARHYVVIDVRGSAGTRIDICVDGRVKLRDNGYSDWLTWGSPDMSISSMACGANVTCVGSATTRDTAPLLSGGASSWAGFVEAGSVSGFSSYGTTYDGRTLPHFCAPGAYVVSAYSRAAIAADPESVASMAAESAAAPGHYYYAECGTSMASPHAAGIYALWLEADPTLTGNELREIAETTARYEGLDAADPRSGAGMIDAVAGLQHILKLQGLADADIAGRTVRVWREGGALRIDGAGDAAVAVCDMTGRAVAADNLPASPVVVKIVFDDGMVVRKI